MLLPQFYIQLVYKATLSFTLTIWILSGSLFWAKKYVNFKKKNHKRDIMQLFFAHEKLRKSPWAAQMAQTEELIFQNVAYRPTVHKTGVTTHLQEKRDGIKQRAD